MNDNSSLHAQFQVVVDSTWNLRERRNLREIALGITFQAARIPPDDNSPWLASLDRIPAAGELCDVGQCGALAVTKWRHLAFCRHHADEVIPWNHG